MGESWIVKVMGTMDPECFLLLLCLCMSATVNFLWYLWRGVNGHGEIPIVLKVVLELSHSPGHFLTCGLL